MAAIRKKFTFNMKTASTVLLNQLRDYSNLSEIKKFDGGREKKIRHIQERFRKQDCQIWGWI